MKLKFLLTTLLFTSLLLSFFSSNVYAGKGGLNIADHWHELDLAAGVVKDGGWITMMPRPGDCSIVQNAFTKYENRINFIVRGHYPDNVPTAELAKAWAATLGKVETSDIIYFYPWNEPNMARECGGAGGCDATNPNCTACVPLLQNYVNAVMSEFSAAGILDTKVRVLSPMINQSAPNFTNFVNALGPSFFNQFYGITLNAYDFQECGSSLCHGTDLQSAIGNHTALQVMGVDGKPMYAVETGVANPQGEVTDFPAFSDPSMYDLLTKSYNTAWGGDGAFKMFSPLTYNPEIVDRTPWVYGGQTESWYSTIAGGGTEKNTFDPSNKFNDWFESQTLVQCNQSCGYAPSENLCAGSNWSNTDIPPWWDPEGDAIPNYGLPSELQMQYCTKTENNPLTSRPAICGICQSYVPKPTASCAGNFTYYNTIPYAANEGTSCIEGQMCAYNPESCGIEQPGFYNCCEDLAVDADGDGNIDNAAQIEQCKEDPCANCPMAPANCQSEAYKNWVELYGPPAESDQLIVVKSWQSRFTLDASSVIQPYAGNDKEESRERYIADYLDGTIYYNSRIDPPSNVPNNPIFSNDENYNRIQPTDPRFFSYTGILEKLAPQTYIDEKKVQSIERMGLAILFGVATYDITLQSWAGDQATILSYMTPIPGLPPRAPITTGGPGTQLPRVPPLAPGINTAFVWGECDWTTYLKKYEAWKRYDGGIWHRLWSYVPIATREDSPGSFSPVPQQPAAIIEMDANAPSETNLAYSPPAEGATTASPPTAKGGLGGVTTAYSPPLEGGVRGGRLNSSTNNLSPQEIQTLSQLYESILDTPQGQDMLAQVLAESGQIPLEPEDIADLQETLSAIPPLAKGGPGGATADNPNNSQPLNQINNTTMEQSNNETLYSSQLASLAPFSPNSQASTTKTKLLAQIINPGQSCDDGICAFPNFCDPNTNICQAGSTSCTIKKCPDDPDPCSTSGCGTCDVSTGFCTNKPIQPPPPTPTNIPIPTPNCSFEGQTCGGGKNCCFSSLECRSGRCQINSPPPPPDPACTSPGQCCDAYSKCDANLQCQFVSTSICKPGIDPIPTPDPNASPTPSIAVPSGTPSPPPPAPGQLEPVPKWIHLQLPHLARIYYANRRLHPLIQPFGSTRDGAYDYTVPPAYNPSNCPAPQASTLKTTTAYPPPQRTTVTTAYPLPAKGGPEGATTEKTKINNETIKQWNNMAINQYSNILNTSYFILHTVNNFLTSANRALDHLAAILPHTKGLPRTRSGGELEGITAKHTNNYQNNNRTIQQWNNNLSNSAIQNQLQISYYNLSPTPYTLNPKLVTNPTDVLTNLFASTTLYSPISNQNLLSQNPFSPKSVFAKEEGGIVYSNESWLDNLSQGCYCDKCGPNDIPPGGATELGEGVEGGWYGCVTKFEDGEPIPGSKTGGFIMRIGNVRWENGFIQYSVMGQETCKAFAGCQASHLHFWTGHGPEAEEAEFGGCGSDVWYNSGSHRTLPPLPFPCDGSDRDLVIIGRSFRVQNECTGGQVVTAVCNLSGEMVNGQCQLSGDCQGGEPPPPAPPMCGLPPVGSVPQCSGTIRTGPGDILCGQETFDLLVPTDQFFNANPFPSEFSWPDNSKPDTPGDSTYLYNSPRCGADLGCESCNCVDPDFTIYKNVYKKYTCKCKKDSSGIETCKYSDTPSLRQEDLVCAGPGSYSDRAIEEIWEDSDDCSGGGASTPYDFDFLQNNTEHAASPVCSQNMTCMIEIDGQDNQNPANSSEVVSTCCVKPYGSTQLISGDLRICTEAEYPFQQLSNLSSRQVHIKTNLPYLKKIYRHLISEANSTYKIITPYRGPETTGDTVPWYEWHDGEASGWLTIKDLGATPSLWHDIQPKRTPFFFPFLGGIQDATSFVRDCLTSPYPNGCNIQDLLSAGSTLQFGSGSSYYLDAGGLAQGDTHPPVDESNNIACDGSTIGELAVYGAPCTSGGCQEDNNPWSKGISPSGVGTDPVDIPQLAQDYDPGSPKLPNLFSSNPAWMDAAYNVNGIPSPGWISTYVNVAEFNTSGDILVPPSAYNIGQGCEVMIIHADDNSISLKYTREDNVVIGYTLHIRGLNVNPDILSAYGNLDSNGRKLLPALAAGQTLGTSTGTVQVIIRDTGTYMDPRSQRDWW